VDPERGEEKRLNARHRSLLIVSAGENGPSPGQPTTGQFTRLAIGASKLKP